MPKEPAKDGLYYCKVNYNFLFPDAGKAMINATILNIQARNKTTANDIANINDFQFTTESCVDLKKIIENPNVSLYCLDTQNKLFVFVEISPDIDLYNFPFLYEAQYNHAQRLFTIPWDGLNPLIDDIKNIENLILIYSVGRCGSTVLSNAFGKVNGVFNLSEPDVFSQLVAMRDPDKSQDDLILRLLKICFILHCKNNFNKTCVIKFRGFCIELADLINQIFPQAKALFLYRNGEAVVKSFIRAFPTLNQKLPQIKSGIKFYSRFYFLLNTYQRKIDFDDPDAVDFYTVGWLSLMERYLLFYKEQIIDFAVRYEDLVARPETLVKLIFLECNLPTNNVRDVCQVFYEDSQKDSSLSQAITHKNPRQTISGSLTINQKVKLMLDHHPMIKTPNIVVLGTIRV